MTKARLHRLAFVLSIFGCRGILVKKGVACMGIMISFVVIMAEYGLQGIGFCSICYAIASLIGYFIEGKSVPRIVDGILYIFVILSLPVSFWGVSIYDLYKSRLKKQHEYEFDRLFYISAISEMPDDYNIERYHLSCYQFIDKDGMFDIERWRSYELGKYDQGVFRLSIIPHHSRLIPTSPEKPSNE